MNREKARRFEKSWINRLEKITKTEIKDIHIRMLILLSTYKLNYVNFLRTHPPKTRWAKFQNFMHAILPYKGIVTWDLYARSVWTCLLCWATTMYIPRTRCRYTVEPAFTFFVWNLFRILTMNQIKSLFSFSSQCKHIYMTYIQSRLNKYTYIWRKGNSGIGRKGWTAEYRVGGLCVSTREPEALSRQTTGLPWRFAFFAVNIRSVRHWGGSGAVWGKGGLWGGGGGSELHSYPSKKAWF